MQTLTVDISMPILIYMNPAPRNRNVVVIATALVLVFSVGFIFVEQIQAEQLTQPSASETGLASYYAGKFQGRLTANGEIFDTNRFTAAHKTLPFNTIVKVTNARTGKSVLVRINDRGPFVPGRIIDLSRAAADAISMVGVGLETVTVEVVEFGDGRTYHKSGPPSDTVTIQIGAYGDEENAHRVLLLLESHRLAPVLEKSAGGLTRVILPDVYTGDLKLTRLKLADLGLTDVLVRR
jgi:rare lipoprotein A